MGRSVLRGIAYRRAEREGSYTRSCGIEGMGILATVPRSFALNQPLYARLVAVYRCSPHRRCDLPSFFGLNGLYRYRRVELPNLA